jgi:hypothetical protein
MERFSEVASCPGHRRPGKLNMVHTVEYSYIAEEKKEKRKAEDVSEKSRLSVLMVLANYGESSVVVKKRACQR